MKTINAIINANGIAVNYRLEGPDDGPVVMLSNSLMSNLSMWDAQAPALARRYRLLRYDTRGHGATEGTPPPYSIDLLVDDARALLDALDIASVHFVGLSLGGMIGQLFAARHPAHLKSLVLCDTSCHMPPTLVIVGADDPATTVAASEIIHRAIAGSELVVLDNAAHLSNIEQPEAFTQALIGFLEKN